MTTQRHAAVRMDDPHGPCPFCGCGLVSPARAPKRAARGHHGRVTYRGPAITLDELPADWRPFMRSTLKRDDGALVATKALNAAIAAKQAEGYALVAKPIKNGQRVSPEWVRTDAAPEVAA